jgi:Niemann-Pick C1 protein
VLGLN